MENLYGIAGIWRMGLRTRMWLVSFVKSSMASHDVDAPNCFGYRDMCISKHAADIPFGKLWYHAVARH
jgi:hypothetical protein